MRALHENHIKINEGDDDDDSHRGFFDAAGADDAVKNHFSWEIKQLEINQTKQRVVTTTRKCPGNNLNNTPLLIVTPR